jgi:hypothetical protein
MRRFAIVSDYLRQRGAAGKSPLASSETEGFRHAPKTWWKPTLSTLEAPSGGESPIDPSFPKGDTISGEAVRARSTS